MKNLLEMFCFVDDLCQTVDLALDSHAHLLPKRTRGPKPRMSTSEIVCILLLFHQTGYRNFKTFYLEHVSVHMRAEFPQLLSYTRFVECKAHTTAHLWALLQLQMGQPTGLAFIDSTPLRVCRIQRAPQNKVFERIAKKGKTSTGWFYGLKLHLVINEKGELLSIWVSPGNEHDNACVERMTSELVGKLIGDKGYISKELTQSLMERGLRLLTPLRKNMKPQLIEEYEAWLLRKRAVVESVIDQLKNISQIEHTRHRSPRNFFLNLLAGLLAYSLQPKKPSLHLHSCQPSHELVVV